MPGTQTVFSNRQRAHKLRNEYSASQKSHENRRQQLDIHLAEIEELRHALLSQADELQRTEQEKNQMAMEKTDIARTIAALEAELKRVRRDAEIFGRDLKALRAKREKSRERQREDVAKTERVRKQAQTQIRLLNDQLENQRAKTKRLQQHVCSACVPLPILQTVTVMSPLLATTPSLTN